MNADNVPTCKNLLRSVIDVDGTITQENLVFNFHKLQAARIDWGRTDDDKLFKMVTQYFQTQMELPSIATVKDYFERTDDLEVTRRLEVVEFATFYIRSNFHFLLREILAEQRKFKATVVAKETHEIISRGMEIDGERKQGIRDGLEHAITKLSPLLEEGSGWQRVDARDTSLARDLYEKATEGHVGRFCGLENIDRSSGGAKPGDLWTHGAYPGHLKTDFALNWGYNLVTQYNTNAVFVSLEMPIKQIQHRIWTIHTANWKWADRGFPAIDYRKVRDGQLSPEEKDFYLKSAMPDFMENTNYARFEIIRPDDSATMADIRVQVERIHRDLPVGFVVIDYGQWIEPRKGKKNKDYGVELNTIVRDCKAFATQFNGGVDKGGGVPVLLLWQMNRKGHDEAVKNAGVYDLSALTWANEVEKTSDVITASFLDKERRAQRKVTFSCLKNRDNPLFDPFEANIWFEPHRIFTNRPFAENQEADYAGV